MSSQFAAVTVIAAMLAVIVAAVGVEASRMGKQRDSKQHGQKRGQDTPEPGDNAH